jgi:hypothetical protein
MGSVALGYSLDQYQVQYSTVQYSTVQYSTVQYSTVHSTVPSTTMERSLYCANSRQTERSHSTMET